MQLLNTILLKLSYAIIRMPIRGAIDFSPDIHNTNKERGGTRDNRIMENITKVRWSVPDLYGNPFTLMDIAPPRPVLAMDKSVTSCTPQLIQTGNTCITNREGEDSIPQRDLFIKCRPPQIARPN